MGTGISLRTVKFHIPREKFEEARKALEKGIGQLPTDVDFCDALDLLLWEAKQDEEGIQDLEFLGEGLDPQDEKIFQSLAPFIEEGSFIEFMGDDGSLWRWLFTGGECLRQEGKLTWTDQHQEKKLLETDRHLLSLSEEQLRVLSNACELYARLGMGQLTEAVRFAGVQDSNNYKTLRDELRKLKPLITGMDSPHAYRGIGHPDIPEPCNIAWDLHAVLRHYIAWRRDPRGGHTTDFLDPSSFPASKHPLAEVL